MGKKDNNKKGRKGVVYSTDPDFQYRTEEGEEQETLPPEEQDLRVLIDRKQRKGKEVTLITGFTGTADDLDRLGSLLKKQCGVGGSTKDGEIIIQGNQRGQVMEILDKLGYRTKKSGS